MAFPIKYVDTSGILHDVDLLPGGSTLAQRVRILEPQKTLILLDKLKIALFLFADFVNITESGIENFFSFERAVEPSELEIQRQQLFGIIQRVLANEADLNKFARILRGIAATRTYEESFIIPFDTEEPHDYSAITDEQIATLIQKAIIERLEAVLRLI